MKSEITITIPESELRKLRQQLDRYGKLKAKKIRDITKKYEDLIWKEARRIVPVRTGNLRGSIRRNLIRLRDAVIGEVYTDSARQDYAHFVEFGTVNQGARAFMRRAFNKYAQAYVDELRAELKKP